MNENKIFIMNDDGKEVEMNILLTFDANDKNYVVVYDAKDEDSLYAFIYDEEGNLFAVEDEEELAMVDEVISAFEKEKE